MSHLIEFVNNTAINAIYFGLISAGYNYADIEKTDEIIRLIKIIREKQSSKAANDFFSKAYQYTCRAYPYWPRAALMEKATFFINDLYNTDTFDYLRYHNEVMNLPNLMDSERDESFWSWIKEFPNTLKEILRDKKFHQIDEYIKKWISINSKTFENKRDAIEQSLTKLAISEGKEIQPIKVIISPLKCIYSADYQVSEGNLFIVLGDFLPNSIVHECIHSMVHPHVVELREDILKKCFGSKTFDIDESSKV